MHREGASRAFWEVVAAVPIVKKGPELTGEREGLAESSHRPASSWDPGPTVGRSVPPHLCPPLRRDPRALAGVESSLRVTRCRQILRSLPEHNHAVLDYLMGFLHEVSAPRGAAAGRPCPHASAHTDHSGVAATLGHSWRASPKAQWAVTPLRTPYAVGQGGPCPSRCPTSCPEQGEAVSPGHLARGRQRPCLCPLC